MRIAAFIVAGLAAVASAIPATEVVVNINVVTTKSRELQTPSKNLSFRDAALLSIGQGNFPPIIAGFRDIVVTVQHALDGMNPEKYEGHDVDIIFDAFREFVMVHQQLLNILIGKAGIFTTVPFVGEPVAAVLRTIEAVVDALAYSLIDMVQSRVDDFQEQADALSGTLTLSISTYSGL